MYTGSHIQVVADLFVASGNQPATCLDLWSRDVCKCGSQTDHAVETNRIESQFLDLSVSGSDQGKCPSQVLE